MTAANETVDAAVDNSEGAGGHVDEHIDGRTLRRSRNRMAVIEALLDLIREGQLDAGAAEIAERAGVSHRSVFRYFDDLDDLVRTAVDHQISLASELAQIEGLGEGTLDDRIRSLVAGRLALYEHVDGAMRVARMRAPSIPEIDVSIAEVAASFATQLGSHFEPELAVQPPADAGSLLDACLVLTSYDSFDLHTRVLGHDLERTEASISTALSALLTV